jgi:cyclase
MLRKRIIPCLLMLDGNLVKTRKFKEPKYVGDPINAVTIFNDKELDEIILLDIGCSKNNTEINYDILEKVVKECFIPLTYGGGVQTIDQMKKIFSLGVEKIVVNNSAINNPKLLKEAVKMFGSQSIIAGVDVKKSFFKKNKIFSHVSGKTLNKPLEKYFIELQEIGVGEVFLNSVDGDGTWEGYDVSTNKAISKLLNVPIIACGGAGNHKHIHSLFNSTDVMAAALGSMAVYQKKDFGVLINFPLKKERERILYERV